MPEMIEPAPGSRMSFWIATALRARRLAAGITETDMATALGVNWRTVKRLESGRTMGRDIDTFVVGYAYVLGIEDHRDIWSDAVDLWRREGSPAKPQPVVAGPAAAFAEAIRAEALRQIAQAAHDPAARAPKGKRRATR